MHAGAGQVAQMQFDPDGRERQNVVVLIVHLHSGKLLMLVVYDEISAFVDKQIVCKGRLFVVSRHTGFENGMGGLDVLVSMIDPDNDCVVSIFHFLVSFPPRLRLYHDMEKARETSCWKPHGACIFLMHFVLLSRLLPLLLSYVPCGVSCVLCHVFAVPFFLH